MESIVVTEDRSSESRMDAELLESIYRQYYKNVYNYICFRINNHFDAEELAGLVFEKVIGRWNSYNKAYPIEAWLIGIAKNTVTDHLRKGAGRRFVGLDNILELASPLKAPEEVAVTNERHRDLIKAMSRLKDQERQILSMKFATDLKHHEIAKILDISDSNVGVIVYRALKKLRNLMDEGERV